MNHEAVLLVARDGPAPLISGLPGMADRAGLRVAVVVSPGAPRSIFELLAGLEHRGHTVSVWGAERSAPVAPFRGPVHEGLELWFGADVVLAAGWLTSAVMLGVGLWEGRIRRAVRAPSADH